MGKIDRIPSRRRAKLMDQPADVATAAAAPANEPKAAEPRYFNRELSWLAFNRRVLEEACNPRHPVLERIRFLSISANNLDEFFMVRVAGLRAHQMIGVEELSIDGLTVAQQLSTIIGEADRLVTSQHEVWATLQGELDAAGMHVVGDEPLEPEAEAWLDQHFREQIFPILTPQAMDPAHPFPFIPNKGLSLIFELKKGRTTVRVLIMAPAALPRFIRLPGANGRYIALENLIRRKTEYLFPKYQVLRGGAFRIIRDSDIEVEEEAEDLVLYFRTAIKRRRRGRVVRLELESDTPDSLVGAVQEGLDASSANISQSRGFLGMDDLSQLVDEDRADLKFTPFDPRFPDRVREHGGDCFAAISEKDILVHHPYESFEVVVAFIQQAAADPDVIAIKQTLYRAGKQSAIIKRADRCGRIRQVGDRSNRTEGALRRRTELALGECARARRRSGRLRLHRLEDPRQSVDGRPPRGERLPHLLPLRDRKLPPGDSAHLHRPQLLHRGCQNRSGRCQTVQLHHRLPRAAQSQAPGDLAAEMRAELIKLIDAEIASARAGKPAASGRR